MGTIHRFIRVTAMVDRLFLGISLLGAAASAADGSAPGVFRGGGGVVLIQSHAARVIFPGRG
jgi:hypothetical protein